MKTKDWEVLTGIGLIPGKGKGRAFIFRRPDNMEEDVEGTLDRVAKELEHQKDDIFAQFVRLIITDGVFRSRLKTCLEMEAPEKVAVDIALRPLIRRMREGDPFFARKAQEIVQIIHDILHNGTFNLPIGPETVFIGEEISVPLALKLKEKKVAAVVVGKLASDSHAAIILANAQIPTVVGISSKNFQEGELLYVDGEAGIVSRRPIPQQERIVHVRKGRFFQTADGQTVEILLNVDIPEDLYWAKRYETGIGLLRTEYLISQSIDRVPWEDFASLGNPVIIRAYDVGGDKYHGERSAMRLLNDLKEEFDALLEVIRRFPNFHIMIPMVAFPETARTFYTYLKDRGINGAGFMVEIPSFALALEKTEPYSSFFSVGTNDLWAFFTGRGRGKSDIKEQIHPVFGDLLRHILKVTSKPTSVCGQLASDEDGLRFLLSLGYRRFSVSPSFFVRAVKVVEAWRDE
ncbi:MAG: hypothetical protein GXO39_07435 [Thermotogae bacterium]|nr:hypothetical protein [Thermotogota bacterium]